MNAPIYGWQSVELFRRRAQHLELPYCYYLDMNDKPVLVQFATFSKDQKLEYADAKFIGQLKKFYKATKTPL
jgi:hypothetical protein